MREQQDAITGEQEASQVSTIALAGIVGGRAVGWSRTSLLKSCRIKTQKAHTLLGWGWCVMVNEAVREQVCACK